MYRDQLPLTLLLSHLTRDSQGVIGVQITQVQAGNPQVLLAIALAQGIGNALQGELGRAESDFRTPAAGKS
ncbi:hypothetical protein D3C79_1063630 [compost metagenome]